MENEPLRLDNEFTVHAISFNSSEIVYLSVDVVEDGSPAGKYVIAGGLRVTLAKRPNWWTRMWSRLLLGWVWEDG